MRYVDFKGTKMKVSRLALGCRNFEDKTIEEVEALIKAALDLGINFFNHSHLYDKNEKIFGEALKKHPEWRKNMYIQSSCGIVSENHYDSSQEYILKCVDESLENLNIDYLDMLVLQHPDVLMDPQELALTFDILYRSGKVKYFGVGNMNSMQIELIKKFVSYPIVVNMMDFNLVQTDLIDNMNSVGGLLEYCYLHDMTIQSSSVFKTLNEETFINHVDYQSLNNKLVEVGKKYNLNRQGMALAWILRHPSRIQSIAEITDLNMLNDLAKACDVKISRDDFYDLYKETK